MTDAPGFEIQAVVTAAERMAIRHAAELLARSLTIASKTVWTLSFKFAETINDLEPSPGPSIVVTSLLDEAGRTDEPWSACETRLRRIYTALCGDPARSVYICTALRHVDPELPAHRDILVRIRRLNLLAMTLSNELGLLVADIDRDLAHAGARTLQTDYRLQGPYAAQFAAKSLAMTMLLIGLDDFAPFETQEAARRVVKAFNPPQPDMGRHRPDRIGSHGYRTDAGGRRQIVMK
jgi:hypothetical protein